MSDTSRKKRLVRWSMKDTVGCVKKGEMTVEMVQKELLFSERLAVRTMRDTGADHVLYGIKIYDEDGDLKAVEFCMKPMEDEEFYRLTGKARNVMIYALHNHQKSGYSL